MLRYRARLHCYVGRQLVVTVDAFDTVLLRLMKHGYRPEDAYTLLLLESEWDAAWSGVTVRGGTEAVAATERLLQRPPFIRV